MKRACLMILSLAGLSAWTGCVTRAEYDKLYSSWETCNKQYTEQRQLLAATEAELKTVKQERDRLAIERDEVSKSWQARYDSLDATYRKLLAEQGQAPVINVTGGVLPKALNEALLAFAKENGLEYDAARGAVRFSSDLLFDPGSYTLKPDVAKKLADFAKIINMQEALAFDVLVVGHTDGMPISRAVTKEHTPTNWHLSVFRAVSVVLALQGDRVRPDRLGAMGFGAERPRPGTNNSVTKMPGTPANRRVEVFLVPHQSLSAASSEAPIGPITGDDIAAAFGQN